MLKFNKRHVGQVATFFGVIGLITLPLLMLGIIDLNFLIFSNESTLRVVAQFTVLNFLIAAWAYWEI